MLFHYVSLFGLFNLVLYLVVYVFKLIMAWRNIFELREYDYVLKLNFF